jgi:nucleotide-binding universal stress UspA family protein
MTRAAGEGATMIRKILCPVSGGAGDRAVLDAAAALAQRFASHVQVLHARPDASEIGPYLGEGMSPALIGQIMQQAQRRADDQAAVARAGYDDWLRTSDLVPADVPTIGEAASCAWIEEAGAQERWIGRLGRLSDLTIVPSLGLDGSVGATLAFEAALLDTARPVLVMPSGALALDAVAVIAWNGSAEASRALGASLPLLAACRDVHVVTIEEGDRQVDPEEVVRYLAWHRIGAHAQLVAGKGKVASTTVAEACATRGAGLLVMGGYTHSRLRELIFGGVTAHMIRDAAIPLFLAH